MTSTELAHTDSSEISLLPPSRPPAEAARSMLMAHAEMMQSAFQLASKMVNTTMVPTRFMGRDKADDATAAILYGAELGLNPIQSLQRIIPIHGMPSMEARTMVALLKSRGYKIRVASQSPASVTVIGIDLEGEQYESTWTIERAHLAGYVPTPVEGSKKRPDVQDDWVTTTKSFRNGGSKTSVLGNMKYITDPQAMLKAKAQSEVCRDMAPDVLLGISYTSEELMSERWDEPQPERRAASGGSAAPITVEEIFGDRGSGDAAADAEVVDAEEVQDEPAADEEAGHQSQGAAPPASPTPPSDSGDQPTPEPQADAADPVIEKVDTPAPKKAPAKKAAAKADAPAAEKSGMRKALEKRLFTLIGDIQPEVNREDRILLYGQILDRDDITSTDDLDDYTIAKVADQLYVWQQAHELDDKVRDLLNSADLAAAIAEEEARPTTEGK